jgi:hypothetical protein
MLWAVILDQLLGLRQVVGLPRREDDLNRVAQRIDRDMDLGAEPAARPA